MCLPCRWLRSYHTFGGRCDATAREDPLCAAHGDTQLHSVCLDRRTPPVRFSRRRCCSCGMLTLLIIAPRRGALASRSRAYTFVRGCAKNPPPPAFLRNDGSGI
jgi:hypothetical protein